MNFVFFPRTKSSKWLATLLWREVRWGEVGRKAHDHCYAWNMLENSPKQESIWHAKSYLDENVTLILKCNIHCSGCSGWKIDLFNIFRLFFSGSAVSLAIDVAGAGDQLALPRSAEWWLSSEAFKSNAEANQLGARCNSQMSNFVGERCSPTIILL